MYILQCEDSNRYPNKCMSHIRIRSIPADACIKCHARMCMMSKIQNCHTSGFAHVRNAFIPADACIKLHCTHAQYSTIHSRICEIDSIAHVRNAPYKCLHSVLRTCAIRYNLLQHLRQRTIGHVRIDPFLHLQSVWRT